jgi:competence protein ComEC
MALTKTNTLIFICIFLLFGLFISKYFEPISIYYFLIFSLLAVIFYRFKTAFIFTVCLAAFAGGLYRGGLLQQQNLSYQDFYYKKVTITGIASEDGFYSDSSQLEFTVGSVKVDGKSIPGKVKIKGFGSPAVYRYDLVEATGKLYPSVGSRQASMSYADINVIATTNSLIDNIRTKFIIGIETSLPEPAASFAIGILVGQRSLLPEYLMEALTIVGLVHIVAVSGYNLTIIVNFVRRIGSKLSRFQLLFISLVLIYGFILISGFSPSIVRASLVSFLSLTAWYFGRKIRPALLILLVASITAFYNPYYIWSDIGWYLSFLAFVGILIIAPILIRLFRIKNNNGFASMAVESFSAQVMTTPLIMMIFGRVSLIGIIANIIIVPLVPLAMFFSFIAGLIGAILPNLSAYLAIPARLLLNLMILITEKLATVPGAYKLVSVGFTSMLLIYGSILIFYIGLRKRLQSVKI